MGWTIVEADDAVCRCQDEALGDYGTATKILVSVVEGHRVLDLVVAVGLAADYT